MHSSARALVVALICVVAAVGFAEAAVVEDDSAFGVDDLSAVISEALFDELPASDAIAADTDLPEVDTPAVDLPVDPATESADLASEDVSSDHGDDVVAPSQPFERVLAALKLADDVSAQFRFATFG